MKVKKWIFELQQGEVFTILPNVKDASHYFIALGTSKSCSMYGSRVCCVFNDYHRFYDFANVQVYSCGLIVTNINSSNDDC